MKFNIYFILALDQRVKTVLTAQLYCEDYIRFIDLYYKYICRERNCYVIPKGIPG